MGLYGRRTPNIMTVGEMNPTEFEAWKKGWIGYEATKLKWAQVSEHIALMTAQSAFDQMQKTGFKARDEHVLKQRARLDKPGGWHTWTLAK